MEQYSYLENGFEGKKRTIFFDNQFEKNHTNKIYSFLAEQKQTNGPMFFLAIKELNDV